ncbi:MAG: ribonuclease J, partial [Hyphomicrobiaceae bacterium]
MAKSAQSTEELVYLPLGGAGEIGMNLYLYGLGPPDRRQWLMVDLGVTFPGEYEPGVDIIMPETRFIEEERSQLAGIVLTHAHEDHFGAVIDLWPDLGAPIYSTPFTATLLKTKLAEFGGNQSLPIHEVELGARFQVGSFDLEFVTMAHSIPEPNALAIRTPAGMVVHTGDWKLDPDPVVGAPSDEKRLKELGDEGVDVLVCDSTNVFRDGISPSEAEVGRSLTEIIRAAKYRVAVTTFASNVARILSVARATKEADRHLVVVGRAMLRIIQVARETGKLPKDFRFHEQNEFGYLPREDVVLLCTGSQGESRAALARVSEDQHPHVALAPRDIVVFSSRTIPGNEKAVGRVQNALAAQGIVLVTDNEALVHVTGHPRRGELAEIYKWTRPKSVIPMHGEVRHLEEHARYALANGIEQALPARNGDVIRLLPG